jgi:hypothetical protein
MKKIFFAMLVVSASMAAQAKVMVSINSLPLQELQITRVTVSRGMTIETNTETYEITETSLRFTGVSGKELIDLIMKFKDHRTKNVELGFEVVSSPGRNAAALSSVSVSP